MTRRKLLFFILPLLVLLSACAKKAIDVLPPQPLVIERFLDSYSLAADIYEQAIAVVPPSMKANVIEIVEEVPEPILEEAVPGWDIFEKIEEGFNLVEDRELFTGDRDITYYETRFSTAADGRTTSSRVKITEEEKEVALAVLNSTDGSLEVVIIRKKGDILTAPAEYDIEIGTRVSGIKWNYWNTIFKINKPENRFVVALKYPTVSYQYVKTKRTKKVNYVYYSPYSQHLHRPDTVMAGSNYITDRVNEAFDELRTRNVMSKAFPGKLVADVFADRKDYFRRLPLLEQSDLGEFIFDPLLTAQRVLVLVGTNKEKAFAPTCNSSKACGWVQFTPGTYSTMRKTYKTAGLTADFKTGASDHKNSIMAAILLHDNNLKPLIDRFGQKIYSDPNLEEYLAASYNGSPRWVWQSLNATIGRSTGDWTKHLRRETLGFMVKLRFLRGNNLPYSEDNPIN